MPKNSTPLGAIVPGLALLVVGVTFAVASTRYNLGTVNRMGPGFLPLVLGIVLAGLGLVEMIGKIGAGAALARTRDKVNWYAVGCFLGSLLAFALLVESAGFVPAIFLATFIAMMADRPVRPLAAVLYGIGFAIAGDLVFLKGLGMPISSFWW